MKMSVQQSHRHTSRVGFPEMEIVNKFEVIVEPGIHVH